MYLSDLTKKWVFPLQPALLWVAQERSRWIPIMSRASLSGDKRWPCGCWKDPRESEIAMWLDEFTFIQQIYAE